MLKSINVRASCIVENRIIHRYKLTLQIILTYLLQFSKII